MKTLESYLAAGAPAPAVFTSGLSGAAVRAGHAHTLNYVGIDTVRVVTAAPEPSSYLTPALGLGALIFMRREPSI
jgi:hypothetical protein